MSDKNFTGDATTQNKEGEQSNGIDDEYDEHEKILILADTVSTNSREENDFIQHIKSVFRSYQFDEHPAEQFERFDKSSYEEDDHYELLEDFVSRTHDELDAGRRVEERLNRLSRVRDEDKLVRIWERDHHSFNSYVKATVTRKWKRMLVINLGAPFWSVVLYLIFDVSLILLAYPVILLLLLVSGFVDWKRYNS